MSGWNVKEKYNLPKIINLYVMCANLKKFTNFVQSQFWWRESIAVLMILDPSSYNKVLSWSFMGLIRSELCYLWIRIQKQKIYCLFRSRTNRTWLKKLIIKKLLEQNFHALWFISKLSYICFGSLVNFVVVAVFINCSNS